MRERLLALAGRLRADGLAVSVGETLDALAAVAVAGVEREVLREALAATLVKDEDDRAVFERRFAEAFPLGGAAAGSGGRGRRRASRRDGGGDAGGDAGAAGGSAAGSSGGAAAGAAGGSAAGAAADAPGEDAGGATGGTPLGRAGGAGPPAEGRPPAGTGSDREGAPGALHAAPAVSANADTGGRAASGASRRARARELRRKPFVEYTGEDVREARALVAELGRRLRGRLARRERERRRGRIDLRRTLREAARAGGVPLRLRRRGRRPGRADLVALCDLSGSVAAVSELLLGLLAPAADHFRRVALFGFVDRLCPVSIEAGHVAPGGSLDLWARSDFGRVLGDLWPAHEALLGPGTVLLVLGDARNNRLPPRPDLLRAVRERVQRVLWINPEPRARWSTGDSVQHLYAPLCDAVLEGGNLDAMVTAVRRLG